MDTIYLINNSPHNEDYIMANYATNNAEIEAIVLEFVKDFIVSTDKVWASVNEFCTEVIVHVQNKGTRGYDIDYEYTFNIHTIMRKIC